MTTPNMGLDLPIPGVTTGPDWANKINAAFTGVDGHNHSPGNGAPISIANVSGAGTMAQQSASAVSITGGAITGLSPPVSPADAATKAYVDAGGGANAIALGFDPTGTTPMGDLLFTATAACRAAGIHEIVFPPGTYKILGSENIAPSSLPNQPFRLRGMPGATIIPHAYPSSTASVCAIQAWAWGNGDTIGPGLQGSTINANSANCVSFVMTVVGGENVLTGFSDTSTIAVGSTVLLYIGADLTDAGGWPNSWLFATVTAKTSSTITIDGTLPSPCPTPDGNVGINTVRTHQTHHTLRTITGFNDRVEITGFTMDSTFISLVFVRYPKVDCFWSTCYFGINATGTLGLNLDFVADKVTGYDTGGGGAYSHYGGAIALESCYGTQINKYITDRQDGVGCVQEELSCMGTRIGLMSINTDARLSSAGTVQITGANGGANNLTSIDHLIIRGGYGQFYTTSTTRIHNFENRGTVNAGNCFIRVGTCDAIVFRGQSFRGKTRLQTLVIPIPVGAGTITRSIPQNGLVSRVWLSTTTMTGVTAVVFDGTAAGSACDVTSLITSNNQWLDMNPPALMAVGTPNVFGYCSPRIKITTNGSTPANNVMLIDVEMMLADMAALGQPVMADTTAANPLTGNGAPSINATYLGQRYYNFTGKVWYTAKDIGTGSSDWA